MKHEGITLVADAIHNQAEPRHYMTIKESPKFWLAKIEEQILAKSHTAIELKEVGLDIYPPVIYFPLKDVVTTHLKKNKKSKSQTKGFALRSITSRGRVRRSYLLI